MKPWVWWSGPWKQHSTSGQPTLLFHRIFCRSFSRGSCEVVKILAYATAEQGVRCSNPGLATSISEIVYLLLPSRDMTERLLKLDLYDKNNLKIN